MINCVCVCVCVCGFFFYDTKLEFPGGWGRVVDIFWNNTLQAHMF